MKNVLWGGRGVNAGERGQISKRKTPGTGTWEIYGLIESVRQNEKKFQRRGDNRPEPKNAELKNTWTPRGISRVRLEGTLR